MEQGPTSYGGGKAMIKKIEAPYGWRIMVSIKDLIGIVLSLSHHCIYKGGGRGYPQDLFRGFS